MCKPALINDMVFFIFYSMHDNCAILYCTVHKFVFLSVCLSLFLGLSVLFSTFVVNKCTHNNNNDNFYGAITHTN